MVPLLSVLTTDEESDLPLRRISEPPDTSFTVPLQAELFSGRSAGSRTVVSSSLEEALRMVLVKLFCTRWQPS